MPIDTVQAMGALLIGGVLVFALPEIQGDVRLSGEPEFPGSRPHARCRLGARDRRRPDAGARPRRAFRRRRADRVHAGDERHAAALLGLRGAGAAGIAQRLPDQPGRRRWIAGAGNGLTNRAASGTSFWETIVFTTA